MFLVSACSSSSSSSSGGGGGGGGTNPFGQVIGKPNSTPSTPSAGRGDGDKIADKGDIRVKWTATEDADIAELAQAIQDSGLIEEIADNLNMTLRFPNDLTITHLDCGEENAFYLPEKRGVFLCYEMLKRILVTIYDERASAEQNTQRLVGAWMFVMFHELGHALIDQYKLPITGKEEDAVDDFSAVVLIEGGLSELAVNAAVFWALADKGMYESLDFADEHSLNPQRFFNILCTVYGSSPNEYSDLVDPELLPDTRAKGCAAEYQQKSTSWNKLLEPYAK